MTLPVNYKRHTNTAFPDLRFLSAQTTTLLVGGFICPTILGVGAIVTREDDQCVFN